MWVPPWLAGRFNPALHGPFQPQLAVLIDLTNSNRYYDFRSEVPNGVAYVKVRARREVRIGLETG